MSARPSSAPLLPRHARIGRARALRRVLPWALTLLLTACRQAQASTPTATVRPAASATATPRPAFTASPTATATATSTSTPRPTATGTLPKPPSSFFSWKLQAGVVPVNYMADRCTYYRLRWSPEGSPPGTVVAPVFFHSIRTSPGPMPDGVSIPEAQFKDFAEYASSQGFQTITVRQLIAFLTQNAPIPPRSMILIVDDRRPGVVGDNFMPVLKANNWTVTVAWPVDDTTEEQWATMEGLNATGRLDVQAHGWVHNIPIWLGSSDAFIQHEVVDPVAVLEKHFGTRPLAFIWPGGGFTKHAADIARQAGYQLGFTSTARGPLMFGWVPLGAEEVKIGDPLMVLPRDWAPTWDAALRRAMGIAEEARQFALRSYPAEAAWYRQVCGGELPQPPALTPAP